MSFVIKFIPLALALWDINEAMNFQNSFWIKDTHTI